MRPKANYLVLSETEYEMEKSFDTSSYDKDSYKRIMAISDEMEKRKNKTLGNNEIVELERLLYEEVDSRKTLPTPENVIDEYNKNGLKGWGVYGEDYTPELISFAGDKIPKK